MQSHSHSILEAICNTISGFVISLLYQYYIANPQLGHESVDWRITTFVVLQFTLISIVRSYIWRRLWNKVTIRQHKITILNSNPYGD